MQLEYLDDGGRQEIDADIDGVVLRELTPEDAQAYFDLIDADREHFRSVREDTADNYDSVDKVIESFTTQSSERKRFGIWHGGVLVGSMNYEPVDEHAVEVGYWVGKEHAGHHYAGKALRTLTAYLFEEGWNEIQARAWVNNTASRRTLVYGHFLYQYYIDDDGYALYKAYRASYPHRDIH
jgi:RimJ/RimL family protein N-acetyltransferase